MIEKLYLLTFKGSLHGFSGEVVGSNYDLNDACKRCGTGATLIGNLLTKKVKANTVFLETLSGDYLIIDELYHNLRLMNAHIEELLPVLDYKSKVQLPYFHFKTHVYFPKMRPDSEGIITEDQCPICKQDGFYDDHIMGAPRIIRKYKYNFEEVKDLLPKSDFFHTWEHFGKSNLVPEGIKVVRYTRPRIIIKDKVKNIFEGLKIKNFVFEEIILV
jgi:hypothetical protein